MMLGIKYNTGKGSGMLRIDLNAFIPGSARDLKIILNTINLSDSRDEYITAIHEDITTKISDLQKERETLDPETRKSEIAKINAAIKRLIANNDMLVKEYGVEAITDDNATIKLTPSKIYALKSDNGKAYVEELDGWTFTKDGFKFEAYGTKNNYKVLLSGTGLQIAETTKKSEIIAAITPRIVDLLNKGGEKIQKARDNFNKYMNNNSQDTKEADDMKGTTKNTKKAVNYFEGIKTLEELRTKYRDLLKANHPDNGGDLEVMQEINKQYDEAFKLLKSGANLEDDKVKIKWSEEQDKAIREALYKVVFLKGLNIEIVGCWIWIDGETFTNKEALKAAGYEWSRNRKKWHYAPYKTGYRKGSKDTFENIRRKYGSANVENETREEITTK